MADTFPLIATLTAPNGHLKVGAAPLPANELVLTIRNPGEAIPSGTGAPRRLWLRGSLGTAEAALFARKDDARSRCVVSRPDGWEYEWSFPAEGGFLLDLFTFRDTMFERQASIAVRLSKLVSETAPGDAALRFESDLIASPQELTISKRADEPGILYFIAEPDAGVQNLPNMPVLLHWRIRQLEGAELVQASTGAVIESLEDEAGSTPVGSKSTNTTYRLRGYPHGKARPVERDLVVQVLPAGWHDLTHQLFEGDPGYVRAAQSARPLAPSGAAVALSLEPTLLVNADDALLYGVFRRPPMSGDAGLLFRAENPFAPWSLVPTSVPGEAGAIPEDFVESPGVHCDGRIWLVGGSRVDPGRQSNRVWCLDPKQGAWTDCGAADWEPRMGHAVLVWRNSIWVMGGYDASGNARNDVWSLDVATRKWTSRGAASWAPRCMFGAAAFGEEIWVYGGASEPFSEKLHGDAHVYAGDGWSLRELTGILAGADLPIASCLQKVHMSGHDRLALFAKFRSVAKSDRSEKFDTQAFLLKNASMGSWEPLQSDALRNWGGDTTFSMGLLNYRNALLIATALSFEQHNVVMKVHVPGS